MDPKLSDIITEIKRDDISIDELMNLLFLNNTWNVFQSKGVIGMFIFKKILEYLPKVEFKNEESKINLLKFFLIEKKKSKNDDQKKKKKKKKVENDKPFKLDEESIKNFIKEPKEKIKKICDYIIKRLDYISSLIIEEVHLSQFKSAKDVESENENDKPQEGILTFLDANIDTNKYPKIFFESRMFDSLSRSKIYVGFFIFIIYIFGLIKENSLKIGKKLESSKIEDVVFYSYSFSYFYSNFFRNVKNLNIWWFSPISIVNFKNDFDNIDIDSLFAYCKTIENFNHKLQHFWLKNGLNEMDCYINRYNRRNNIIVNSILKNIDTKFNHFLWDTFDKKYNKIDSPDINKILNDMRGEDFISFQKKCITNLKSYIEYIKNSFDNDNSKNQEELGIFESLMLIFMVITWLENEIGISNWSKLYLNMNINSITDNFSKIYVSTEYPMILMIFPNLWGITTLDSIMLFGSVFDVLFQYKEIIKSKHGNELSDCENYIKKYNLSDKFMVFKKDDE